MIFIQSENVGINVPHETVGGLVNSEANGYYITEEVLGADAGTLITGGPIGGLFWLWGDSTIISWGDGQEIEL